MLSKRLWIVSLLVLSLVGSLSLTAAGPVAAATPTLPAGATDEVVMSGPTMPTKIRFAPNGKIFISEKSGIIKMFDSLNDSSPTVVADLRTDVYNLGDVLSGAFATLAARRAPTAWRFTSMGTRRPDFKCDR